MAISAEVTEEKCNMYAYRHLRNIDTVHFAIQSSPVFLITYSLSANVSVRLSVAFEYLIMASFLFHL